MNPFTAAKKKESFSVRSAASIQRQSRLESDLHKNEGFRVVADTNVKKLSQDVEQVKRHMAETGAVLPRHLGDLVRALEDEKLRLQVHEERAASLRDQIKKLESPSAEDAATRLEKQRELLSLAEERYALDSDIGGLVGKLRAALQKRENFSEAMRGIAGEIECDVSQGAVGENVAALLAALPDDFSEKSTEWATRFCVAL